MVPGQTVQYLDFKGKVVNPPCGEKPDPAKVWIQTPDLMLVAVPNSPKLKILDSSKPIELSDDDKELMQKSGIPIPTEPKVEAKFFPKIGRVKLPETKKYPAGFYKVLAGGLDADREELKQVTADLNKRLKNKPFCVASAEDGSWHVVIEVLDKL